MTNEKPIICGTPMQKTVSIVVPCYNTQAYIGEMLQSVYDQIWQSIELILVNDGSTDNTRSVILEWIPRLEARGIAVKLLDQENQGLPGAVLRGMKQITGEYFCTIDSDDAIYPEYLSTMVGWLEEHPDYEWATCNHERALTADRTEPLGKHNLKIFGGDDYVEHMQGDLLEKYLLHSITRAIWTYVVRVSYLDRCRVRENFCTRYRMSQEPSIIVPLAAHKGKLKAFPQPLYRYYFYDGSLENSYKDVESGVSAAEGYAGLLRESILALDIEEKRKAYYMQLAELSRLMLLYSRVEGLNPGEKYYGDLAERLADWLRDFFRFSEPITARQIQDGGFVTLFQAIRNAAPGHKNHNVSRMLAMIKEPAVSARRVIALGAIGVAAKTRLPRLKGTPLEPRLLWDNNAGDGDKAATRPDWSAVSPEDIFIILPNNKQVVKSIVEELKARKLENYFLGSDIAAFQSAHLFPQLFQAKREELI